MPPMPRQPKQHVKDYLDSRGVDPNELGENTYNALDSLTEEQLNALNTVGDGLEKDNAPPGRYRTLIH